jgi:methylase of polypeptide subunit release factors
MGTKTTSKQNQRLLGAHYSPRPIVDFLVSKTLGSLLRDPRYNPEDRMPRICDPACGGGVFLLSAVDRLAKWLLKHMGGSPLPGWLASRIPKTIFGVDIDPTAVTSTRRAIRRAATKWDPSCQNMDLSANIVVGNSLASPVDAPKHWNPISFSKCFPSTREAGRFELVVGNPPFVDAEQMSRSAPQLRKYLSARYATASGNWDLYCIFIERALQLLTSDGRLGFIVPNKLLSADYAQGTRKLLAELDLELLRDYSSMRLFKANVYPLVVVARQRKRQRPLVRVQTICGSVNEPVVKKTRTVDGGKPLRNARDGWSVLFQKPTQTRGMVTLGELCDICGAASVSEAYRIKPLLRECECKNSCYHLVNTGTIDPYYVKWGVQKTRYLGQNYSRPCVDRKTLQESLPRRATQAAQHKIIVAGLARRLECIYDSGNCLAGKSTTVLRPKDNTPSMYLLLGLLNSDAASEMLHRQFAGLALSSGYLRIGPPQLRKLKLPSPDKIPAQISDQIIQDAKLLTQLGTHGCPKKDSGWLVPSERIHQHARNLYGFK